MHQLEILFQKTKESLNETNHNNPNKAIEILKQVQRKLKELKVDNPEMQSKIQQIQIITLNNLACAYNKKGKYKAGLYNLQLVSNIEKNMFQNQEQMNSPQNLHQVATTHSNLCAVYSQLGQHDKAVKQIEAAINFLLNHDKTKRSQALVVFYYNYAIELQHLGHVHQAYKQALKGYQLVDKKMDMRNKLGQEIQRLEQKMRKRQKKVGEYLLQQYKSSNFNNEKPSKSYLVNALSTNYMVQQNRNKIEDLKQIDKNFSAYNTKLPKSLPHHKQYASKSIARTTGYPSVKLPKSIKNGNNHSYYKSITVKESKSSNSKRQQQKLFFSGTQGLSNQKQRTTKNMNSQLIMQSRRKVRSLYNSNLEIAKKSKFSQNTKKETLQKLISKKLNEKSSMQ